MSLILSTGGYRFSSIIIEDQDVDRLIHIVSPFFLFCLLLFPGPDCRAQVQTVSKMLSTKHNLSVSGTGPIKASTEEQICVFCHTPHVPQQYAAVQLWNRPLSTAEYTLYTSDYLTDLNYDTPSQPNPRSKLCLSCHDGTVALGAVYNNRGATEIAMANSVTTMPEDAPGHLGLSLANDHPVGYIYDAAKDPELAAMSWPWNTPVRLDPDDPSGTVECMSCHDAHDDRFGDFLRMSNADAALCTFCHQKSGWEESAHRTSVQSYLPAGGTSTTVGERSCRGCHASHNGEGIPYLLKKVEENTCFESGCHGALNTGPETRDVQTEAGKFYAHPTTRTSGNHRNPDDGASLGPGSRHAECQDCHNSHRVKSGLHAIQTNSVSGVLDGVTGVQPAPATPWTQPTSYTELKPAVAENQICFKCHSSYAFGTVPGGVTTIVGPSGTSITDQAMEFNPANRSAHPVQVSAIDQTGATAPLGLTTDQMATEWGAVGQQTMYCSDCHGADQPASSTVPQGPHGSDYRFMLTGTGKYWPENASGTLWSLNDVRRDFNNWQSDLFCANCHPMKVGSQMINEVHQRGPHTRPEVKCVTCHVVVPHGSKRSRLIGYASDPAPYNYLGTGTYDRLVIQGFRKAPGPNSYSDNNCTMNGICHGTEVGVYED